MLQEYKQAKNFDYQEITYISHSCESIYCDLSNEEDVLCLKYLEDSSVQKNNENRLVLEKNIYQRIRMVANMKMGNKEMMNLFDFILKNKNIIISDKGLFSRDTLTMIKAVIRGKLPNSFKLTNEQKQLIICAFLNSNNVFSEESPNIILENPDCIKCSLSRDINSVNFVKNINFELEDYIIDETLKKGFVLKQNSPDFLKNNFWVSLNSIKLDYTSADFIHWDSMDDEEVSILIDEVLKSCYVLSDSSPNFLTQNIRVVFKSITINPDTIKYANKKLKHEPVIFQYLILNGYNYVDSYIMKRTLNYFNDSKVLEISLDKIKKHITTDKKYIERFNKIYSDAINSRPTIKTFDSIFQNLVEEQWNRYRENNFTYYDNIFGKICAELRNESSFTSVIDNLRFLNKMQDVLGEKYINLYTAMQEYFDIFHSNTSNKLNKLELPKNTISKLSALYVAKSKENYKKEKLQHCYEFIKDYFTLRTTNQYVKKKIIQSQKKEKFKKMYKNQDKDVCNFINEIVESYSRYIDSADVIDMINDFILYNISKLDETIYIPDYYTDYCKYEKAIKLIHRLNSGYIKYDSLEVFKYRNLISLDNSKNEYVYIGRVFSESELKECDEYRKKTKIFDKIKKDIILKICSMNFDSSINSDLLDELSNEVPFNDEYFEFDAKYVLESFNLEDLIKAAMSSRDFELKVFCSDVVYNNVYNLLVNNGLIWLLIFMDFKADYNLKSNNVNKRDIIRIVNNMESITTLAKDFKLDINNFRELLLAHKMSKSADKESLAILGMDIIEKLCKNMDYAFENEEKIISMSKELVCQMTKRSKSTVPYVNGKIMDYNYCLYDSQDATILLAGIYTDACFKISGYDNDFLHYCALNKNGFVIKITDSFGNFIARASGFRNGNCVFINQLRTIYDFSGDFYRGKYDNEREDIINTFKKACEDIVNISQKNTDEKSKIDFVFVTRSYAMESCNSNVSDEVAEKIGFAPMDMQSDDWNEFVNNTNNLEEAKDDHFSTDYGDYPLICIASSKKIEYIKPQDIKKKDVPALYERNRNKIEITNSLDTSAYKKINKIRAVKSYFDKTVFKVIEMPHDSIVFLGDNWYIIYNEGNIINSCLLDFDNSAKIEFEATKQVVSQYNHQHQFDIEQISNELELQTTNIIRKF